jgi:hypothetical protein
MYFNKNAPHQLNGRFALAGFDPYELRPFTADLDICHQGSSHFDCRYRQFQIFQSFIKSDLTPLQVASEETLRRVEDEIESWYKHPHAFFMQPKLAACGRVA